MRGTSIDLSQALNITRRACIAAPVQLQGPTTTLHKPLSNKLDKPGETEQSMPALLAMDPHIRFLRTDSDESER